MVESVLVAGLGVIGGSLAGALHDLEDGPIVYGVDTDGETLAYAAERGLVDAAATPELAERSGWLGSDGAALVVLATPLDVTLEWLKRLAEAGYRGIVTDVASTKEAVVEAARTSGGAYAFVGGHPMAGSERSGVRAADPGLFVGAYYILTPDTSTETGAYRAVHRLVTAIGARVVSVDPASHDRAVAVISHVPHVAASALVELARARADESGEDLLRLAAGGFKDMTRIAAGSPELWTGICLDNAEAVTRGIAELEEVLHAFRTTLAEGDRDSLREWFARAADVRRGLPAQWVPAPSALMELIVPMTDRPGMVATVTTAVSSAGCNIEDIEIDHRSEDSAVLRLVLTEEGDHEALLHALVTRGFHPELRRLGEEVT